MRPKRTILRDLRDDLKLAARFWIKVARAEPRACWEWTAYRSAQGYGKIGIEGRVHFAHRIAWELTHGLMPLGARVLHKCDNPPCCNPDHLFLGTPSENMQDMWNKGRHAPPVNRTGRDWSTKGTGRLRGEQHRSSRLTTPDVLTIREEAAAGTQLTTLAARYGVTKESVWAIVHRKTWKHV